MKFLETYIWHSRVSVKLCKELEIQFFGLGWEKNYKQSLLCKKCREYEEAETKEPLIVTPIPSYRFQVVSADFFTLEDCDYFLVVGYLSKIPVIKCHKQTTVAAQVISCWG